MLEGVTPTPRKDYFLVPALAGLSAGLGAALISVAAQVPLLAIAANGVGFGLALFAPGCLVAVDSIGKERARYWEFRAAQVRAQAPAAEAEPEDEGELVATHRGMALWNRNKNTLQYVKNLSKRRSNNRSFAQRLYEQRNNQVLGRVAVDEQDNPNETSYIDVNMGLWRFARYGAWKKGASTAESNWTGEGKPFSLGEFRTLRDWMIREGLAWWNHPRAIDDRNFRRQGWSFRGRTRGILQVLANQEKPNPPLQIPLLEE